MKTVVKMLIVGVALALPLGANAAEMVYTISTTQSDANMGRYDGVAQDPNGVDTALWSYSGNNCNAALFKFDLSGIPCSASKITKVEIELTKERNGGDSKLQKLLRVTSEWNEMEVTAAVRKTGVDWTNSLVFPFADNDGVVYGTQPSDGDKDTTITFSSDDLTYGTNLLQAVKDMVDGTTPNYGWLLSRESGGNYSDFYSREHSTGQAPRMIITYVPEPATIWLLTLGFGLLYRRRA